MTPSDHLVEFVKGWEQFKPGASADVISHAGVRDVGYGHVLRPGEDFTGLTLAEADALLHEDLGVIAKGVSTLVRVSLAQNQFDALCSFAFNVGLDIDADTTAEGLGDSTLLKYVNSAQFDKVALEFPVWNKSGGVFRWGLAKRRLAEQMMFVRSIYDWRP